MLSLVAIVFASCNNLKNETSEYSALIINGQNNHNWSTGSAALEQILEGSGLFVVDIATSPEKGTDMSSFKPDFSAYDLVVLDYNGDDWCEETRSSFISYVKNGGGVFVMHAADNSFPEWKEYNEITGIGGWKKRNEKDGPFLYWQEGEIVRDNSPGKGGGHGNRHEYVVSTREPEHPIMEGLPDEWMHAKDELYHRLRGPAKNMTILATSWSDPETRGTGKHEPSLMTITYGKGRIFHTTLGHASESNEAMKCAGFVVTSLRGAEWAVTGKVTQAVPENLPTRSEVRLWENYTNANQ